MEAIILFQWKEVSDGHLYPKGGMRMRMKLLKGKLLIPGITLDILIIHIIPL